MTYTNLFGQEIKVGDRVMWVDYRKGLEDIGYIGTVEELRPNTTYYSWTKITMLIRIEWISKSPSEWDNKQIGSRAALLQGERAIPVTPGLHESLTA